LGKKYDVKTYVVFLPPNQEKMEPLEIKVRDRKTMKETIYHDANSLLQAINSGDVTRYEHEILGYDGVWTLVWTVIKP
jgi:hypothetical protein